MQQGQQPVVFILIDNDQLNPSRALRMEGGEERGELFGAADGRNDETKGGHKF
jgi:hypothetical protein